MADPGIYTGKKGLNWQWSGTRDEFVTVSISDTVIELHDHRSNSRRVLPAPVLRRLQINTGKGNDVIHVKTREPLQQPFAVNIDAHGANKFIVGTSDPMVSLQVTHEPENLLVLPDDRAATYERYEPGIRRWNEANRCRDSWFKSIRRRLVYFFGRDLNFRLTPILTEKMKRFLAWLPGHTVPVAPPQNTYFTTPQHIAELNSMAHPGDILLRYQAGYPFDRYFVGVWQHAGFYLRRGRVIDAMGNGIYLRSMEAFAEADGLVLLRMSTATAGQLHQALAYAFEQIGKWYNVDFDDNISEQYCSGLIINAFKFAGILDAGYRHGESIHPDDLLQLPGLHLVWTNRPDLLKSSCKNALMELVCSN
ncbi:MAG: YiiX/YebB-like N1pC/P60 family cysteine hydrolase [Ferruginibacter sp.]